MFRTDSSVHCNSGRLAGRDANFPQGPELGFRGVPRRLGLAQRAAKRAIDIVGALMFFAVLGPVYIVIALSVLVSMGKPVHFWQTRLGRDGRKFRFYKFRSMVPNAEEVLDQYLRGNDTARTEWDTFQKLNQDPRITRIGHVLRKLSLDELPQFWNVLMGDMSLVGPRPCMERQKSLYGKGWAHYCAMRPGITGLWQVSGRNRLTYARRVELDADYLENWSLLLDCKILLKTVRAVITGDGSR